jgi:DNA-directed RNA polymerase subunit RPC12/RpoP
MKKFFKEFRNEIVVITLMVIGIVLLGADIGMRKTIRRSALGAFRQVGPAINEAFNSLVEYVLTLSIFDIIGWVVVIVAVVYIYGRIRYRFRHNPRWEATVCPRCGSRIQRKHRSTIDRLLSKTLMPSSRRYRCTNPECSWTGLRLQRYHLPRVHVDEVNRNRQEIN